MNIKFIKYEEGLFYCSGILTLKIDGTVLTFGNKNCDLPKFWTSGGTYDTDTGDIVISPWVVDKINKDKILADFNAVFDNPYEALEQCLQIMNDNVQYGCCGECL